MRWNVCRKLDYEELRICRRDNLVAIDVQKRRKMLDIKKMGDGTELNFASHYRKRMNLCEGKYTF